jgi:modulator of FtsH protease
MPAQAPNRTTVSHARPSELAFNSVLRNTYLLLGLTLLFTAAVAGMAIAFDVRMMNPWFFLIGMFGLQFLIHATAQSAMGLVSIFLFTGFVGLTLGPVLNVITHTVSNGSQLVMTAAGGTGLIFFGLSGYILTTRRDVSFMGSAIVTGSMVAFVAMLAALFFHIPGLHLAACVLFMLVSSGMIMYQTNDIIQGGERNYILATVTLYLSIYNLFMSLLQLLLSFNSNNR